MSSQNRRFARSSCGSYFAAPRFLEIIHRNAGAMAGLVADLLDISRIEAGGLRLEAVPVDSTGLLREAVDLLTPTAASRGLELHVEAPASLPRVMADRTRMQQVFANLVGNAIKIAADHLPRIFDRFWRPAKQTGAGTGLGLAIVHGIVRAHGGVVAVESAPGAGSTFSFTIPAVAEEPAR